MMKLLILMAALTLNNSTNALPSSRISGPNATEATPNSKPWIVNLGGCGGTLIGRRFVLTALHCFLREGDEVVLGDHDKRIPEQGEQRIKIKKTVPYEIDGIQDDMKADYQILVLEKEVEINKYVQIANLPNPGVECPEKLEVCGWGDDYYFNQTNTNQPKDVDKLMCIPQTCRPSSSCPNPDQLPGFKLCASYPGKPPNDWLNSSCKGDSGGPLFHTEENGLTTIYGVVVAEGRRDTTPCNGPTIYASVSDERILKWIKETMSKYQ